LARMRSIKPEMFRSFTVSGWPVAVRWTFAGLLTYLDDEGRGADDGRLVKAEVYPLDDDMTARKVEQHLSTVAEGGPLCRYEVGGRRYLHITSWDEHQKINRPTKSRIPPCPLHEGSGPAEAMPGPKSGADEDRTGKVRSENGLRESSRGAQSDMPTQRVNPHGALNEGSVSAEGDPLGVPRPAQSRKPSREAHGGLTEPSPPRAQAGVPAEHGAREQGSKGARETATPDAAEPRPGELIPLAAPMTAQTLVAEWIDHCPHRPPGRVVGQVAKLLGEMLAEGIPGVVVRDGLARWHQAASTDGNGRHAATLPSYVHAAGAGPPRSTADRRVEDGLALVAKYAALDAEEAQ
jgi:hypothetical protein